MFLGLDLGTSGIKGLLIDEAQAVVGQANAPLTVTRLKSAWSEQDPDSWIAAAETVLAELSRTHPDKMAGLQGIGLSGQMHGATLLDSSDRVLRPCILWNDTRAHSEASALDGRPGVRELVGSIIFPGFTAPKLAWVKAHEPDTFARVAKVLLPKDYLRLWLTGTHVSEMSDASGTGWLDVGKRTWSDELLALTALSQDHMPALVEGSAPSGILRHALAERFKLPRNVVVAGGAGALGPRCRPSRAPPSGSGAGSRPEQSSAMRRISGRSRTTCSSATWARQGAVPTSSPGGTQGHPAER